MKRNQNTKTRFKRTVSARENVLRNMINQTRDQIIHYELEIEFSKKYLKEVESNSAALDKNTANIVEQMKESLKVNEGNLAYLIERLKFFKEKRDELERKELENAKHTKEFLGKFPETMNLKDMKEVKEEK